MDRPFTAKWLWRLVTENSIFRPTHKEAVLPTRFNRCTYTIPALLAVMACQSSNPGASAQAVFAGGCFWGVEAVFEHLQGVESAVSGFAIPEADTTANLPPLRHSGHVEAVRVNYDPARISYEQLLEVFFLVAHDPTQLDRQGPDRGPQYRSIVFSEAPAQRRLVQQYLDQLRSRGVFSSDIVTELAHLKAFRVAPPEHQDYVKRNPDAAYVRNHDLPKLKELERRYPALYR